MPSRRRSGNLIKKKLHPEVVKIIDDIFIRRPLKARNKHTCIRDFIADIYDCRRNEEQRQMLKAYYHACSEDSLNPPPDGYFDTSDTSNYKYIRHH